MYDPLSNTDGVPPNYIYNKFYYSHIENLKQQRFTLPFDHNIIN